MPKSEELIKIMSITGAGEYPDDDEKWFELHRQDIRNAKGNKCEIAWLKKIFDVRFPNPRICYCCGQKMPKELLEQVGG